MTASCNAFSLAYSLIERDVSLEQDLKSGDSISSITLDIISALLCSKCDNGRAVMITADKDIYEQLIKEVMLWAFAAQAAAPSIGRPLCWKFIPETRDDIFNTYFIFCIGGSCRIISIGHVNNFDPTDIATARAIMSVQYVVCNKILYG